MFRVIGTLCLLTFAGISFSSATGASPNFDSVKVSRSEHPWSCDNIGDRVCPGPLKCQRSAGTDAKQSWPDLELLVRMSSAFKEPFKNVLLRSLRLFWPAERMRLIVVLDEESVEDQEFGKELTSVALQYNLPPFKVFFEAPSKVYESGYDRQQYSMFWADNYTTATYVGFLDTDTIFTTRVHAGDLFECGRPVVHGIVGQDAGTWEAPAKTTAFAMGKPEVMRGMSYFPVILNVSHITDMREDITKRLGITSFHDAFKLLAKGSSRGHITYSQFNIMVNYVFYNRYCDYSFAFGEFSPGDRTVIAGRTPCLDAILNEINTFPRVYVAEHLSYAHETKPVDQYLLEGFCRSTRKASLRGELRPACSNFVDTELHNTLFQFESLSWTWHAMCRKAQSQHYHAIWQEDIEWPLDLLNEIVQ